MGGPGDDVPGRIGMGPKTNRLIPKMPHFFGGHRRRFYLVRTEQRIYVVTLQKRGILFFRQLNNRRALYVSVYRDDVGTTVKMAPKPDHSLGQFLTRIPLRIGEFLLSPFPWQHQTSFLKVAIAENLVFYGFLIFCALWLIALPRLEFHGIRFVLFFWGVGPCPRNNRSKRGHSLPPPHAVYLAGVHSRGRISNSSFFRVAAKSSIFSHSLRGIDAATTKRLNLRRFCGDFF